MTGAAASSRLPPSIVRAWRADRRLFGLLLVLLVGGGSTLLAAAIFAKESLAARLTAAILGVVFLGGGFVAWRYLRRRFALLLDVLTIRKADVVWIRPIVNRLRYVKTQLGATVQDQRFYSGYFLLGFRDESFVNLRVSNVGPEEFDTFRDELASMFPGVPWEAEQQMRGGQLP